MAKKTPHHASPIADRRIKALEAKAMPLQARVRTAIEAADRITAKGYFHHEQYGERPTSFPFEFSDILSTKHQPVVRRLTVSNGGPAPLEVGWIPPSDVGYVAIENRAGKGMLVNPNEEEKRIISTQVVRVVVSGSAVGFSIRPGRMFIAEPEDAASVFLTTESEVPVPINVYIFPK